MNDKAAIAVEDLSKEFLGKVAVDHISLKVRTGEIFGFLGPNGSGKTTTIRMLCGLLTPSSGGGTCLGLDIATQGVLIRRQVGYMTQKFSLYGDLTIEQNLSFVGRLYRCFPLKERVEQQLEIYGLADRKNQLANNLSGGWKQRLALAACSLPSPNLMMLDEPTAGVDPHARRQFWQNINELSQAGVTTLVSTHYMDEAIRCHRIAYILDGKMMVTGSVDKVIATSGLHALRVQKTDIFDLQHKLDNRPEIATTALLGDELQVTGQDKDKLEACVRSLLKKGAVMREAAPSLEDAFVLFAKRKRELSSSAKEKAS